VHHQILGECENSGLGVNVWEPVDRKAMNKSGAHTHYGENALDSQQFIREMIEMGRDNRRAKTRSGMQSTTPESHAYLNRWDQLASFDAQEREAMEAFQVAGAGEAEQIVDWFTRWPTQFGDNPRKTVHDAVRLQGIDQQGERWHWPLRYYGAGGVRATEREAELHAYYMDRRDTKSMSHGFLSLLRDGREKARLVNRVFEASDKLGKIVKVNDKLFIDSGSGSASDEHSADSESGSGSPSDGSTSR
jgi:hypothetical protein